jgi:hypothetical protein
VVMMVIVVVMTVVTGGDGDSDAPRCAPWAGTPQFVCWIPAGGKDTAAGGPLGGAPGH